MSSKLTTSRSFSKRRPTATPRRPPVCLCGDVIPDLQHLLDAVCPSAQACASLYVGSPDDQMRAVQGFYQLARTHDLSVGAAYVLRALLAHDLLTAVELARGFAAYKADLDVINAALEALPPLISLPPGA